MREISLVVSGIESQSTLTLISRSRNYKQYCIMVENALTGVCPFCLLEPAVNKVIEKNAWWQAWHSPAPEKNTRLHFIIAPIEHLTDTFQLSSKGKLSLFDIMDDLRLQFGYTSRGILIRDGDATLSAGTIEHLHVHVMVPDGTGRVESPFYKGEADEANGVLRAIVYEKVRQGATHNDLTLEEQELMRGRLD